MAVLNLVDVDIAREFRVYEERDKEGVLHYYITTSGVVTTVEGKQIYVDGAVELTTAAEKQAALLLFNKWKAGKKAEWGIA